MKLRKKNEREGTGCTSEWEFSRYVLFGEVLFFFSVTQFRNAFA